MKYKSILTVIAGCIFILASCEQERKTWYVPVPGSGNEQENLEEWIPKVTITYYGNCFGENPNGRQLYPWWGEHIVLLSYENTLNASAMKTWVDTMDFGYEYYLKCTRHTPGISSDNYIDGRICIAATKDLPAAGIGGLGWTAIWINYDNFIAAYNSYLNGEEELLTLYELGRNFWMFGSKITYNGDEPECTGYSVFMRKLISMQFRNEDTISYPNELFNDYMSQTNRTWQNTIALDKGIDSQYGSNSTDLFASFLFELQKRYGGPDYIVSFWNYVSERPDAISEQAAVDNIVVAASQAAGKNLCSLFEEWRWPVSQSAKSAIQSLGLL